MDQSLCYLTYIRMTRNVQWQLNKHQLIKDYFKRLILTGGRGDS